MPIRSDLAANFPLTIRTRGDEYWRTGRARLIHVDDTFIEAVVLGTTAYEVTIQVTPHGALETWCECPYFADHGVCKHLWATVRAAEESGHPLVCDVATSSATLPRPRVPAPSHAPRWKRELERLRLTESLRDPVPPADAGEWPERRRLVYIVDATNALAGTDALDVDLATQTLSPKGVWGPYKRSTLTVAQWLANPDDDDREIAQMLLGAMGNDPFHAGYGGRAGYSRFELLASSFGTTLRRICETGRCRLRLRTGDVDPPVLTWDTTGAWELHLSFVPGRDESCRLSGQLARDDERASLAEPVVSISGLVVLPAGAAYVAAPLRDFGAADLARELHGGLVIETPAEEVTALVTELGLLYPRLQHLELPAWLGMRAIHAAPVPTLRIHAMRERRWEAEKLDAELSFEYAGMIVEASMPGTTVAQSDPPLVVFRDPAAEAAAIARLARAGFRQEFDFGSRSPVHRLPSARLARAAASLTSEGWRVEIEGQPVRQGRVNSLRLTSGIDWFELEADTDFGGQHVPLPELLAAMRRGERTVTLGDGSLGTLPEDWLGRYGSLMALGARSGAGVRFGRGQAALLDILLEDMPEVRTDELFERAREELHSFKAVEALDAPAGFVGTLRGYQREGLGWLDALRRFGLGGILADDMGLGKTVQALALLEMRRDAGAGPALVVVPRSLVFNWQEEAARFTPALRVHVHHGPQRRAQTLDSAAHDVVLTTYGTLRLDIAELKSIDFDTVILDEAQAIKNSGTATAKAARLLQAKHRIVMSGTPVENRLSELWSLFHFLSPGLLGGSAAFQRAIKPVVAAPGGTPADEESAVAHAFIARVVRPFILRRTKEQAAPELPPRTEQTLWVELGQAERRLYDELRDHYRASLRGRIERDGLPRAKIHVLEAILRLRQAACHPGLVDRARTAESSSKLEVLLSRIGETASAGHKALVFSQFTSLLAIVRARLDAEGVAYEYLDGRTRDRKARVDRFQSDAGIPLFLISLKAGGLGLNLTAADHVFLLDPWWNPAVEAQAIDRAHRIGQTRPVLAARLIARDTIEEKVLQLQAEKRSLADAIVRSDDGFVEKLTREDIELLLG